MHSIIHSGHGSQVADGPAKVDHSLYNEAQEKLRIEEEEEAARQAAAEAEAGG